MPAICALAVGGRLLRRSFDRYNDGVIHMGILTPRKALSYAWNSSVLEWQSLTLTWECSNPAVHRERWWCGWNTHTCCNVSTSWPDRMSHQSRVCVRAKAFSFSSLFLHHMCEFYRNGWGFQRTLDLSNKPQQAVRPSFSASHRDGDSQWRSESGDWNLITALKPSESNMRERDET